MIYEQLDPDHYPLTATMPTAAGARTSFFSPDLRQHYVAIPHRSTPTAEIRLYQVEP